MNNEVKEFIERHIDKIEKNEFSDLFEIAATALPMYEDVGELSKLLEDAEIYPLDNLDCIPTAYFAGRQDIVRYMTPNRVEEIRARAFQNCSKLKDLILYKDVKWVNACICWNCNFEYLEIQNPDIEFATRAFNHCKIRHIKFNGTKEQFLQTNFYGDTLNGTFIEYTDGSETIKI